MIIHKLFCRNIKCVFHLKSKWFQCPFSINPDLIDFTGIKFKLIKCRFNYCFWETPGRVCCCPVCVSDPGPVMWCQCRDSLIQLSSHSGGWGLSWYCTLLALTTPTSQADLSVVNIMSPCLHVAVRVVPSMLRWSDISLCFPEYMTRWWTVTSNPW